MKVVLYMAMTANGMIATEDDNTPWLKAEWKSFEAAQKKAGNYIMGRRTFDVSLTANCFPYHGLNIVMTKQKIDNKWGDNVVFVKTPQEAINVLKNKKFKTAFLGGGGQANAAFMKENLVDEIILDIEPMIFGKGIKLFAEGDFQSKLKLIGIKKLSKDEIQLRYKVVKEK